MNVKIQTTAKMVPYQDLEYGDVFYFEGNYYMKTDADNGNGDESVRLDNGLLYDFFQNKTVRCFMNAELRLIP